MDLWWSVFCTVRKSRGMEYGTGKLGEPSASPEEQHATDLFSHQGQAAALREGEEREAQVAAGFCHFRRQGYMSCRERPPVSEVCESFPCGLHKENWVGKNPPHPSLSTSPPQIQFWCVLCGKGLSSSPRQVSLRKQKCLHWRNCIGMRDGVGALSDSASVWGRKNSFDCSIVFVSWIVVPGAWEAGMGRGVFPQKSLKVWFTGSIECSAKMKHWASLYFLEPPRRKCSGVELPQRCAIVPWFSCPAAAVLIIHMKLSPGEHAAYVFRAECSGSLGKAE